MNVKALLHMPTWWCFAGNHQPLVRIGHGFVQLDFERVAFEARVGLYLLVAAIVLMGYAVHRDGDWSVVWGVSLVLAGVCGMFIFLLVNTMRSLAGTSVYDALPVPFVRYDADSVPEQCLADIEQSDKEALALMRDMLDIAWDVPVRWWSGFGRICNDICHRYSEEDVKDWLRRRELHRARVYALERRIAKAT